MDTSRQVEARGARLQSEVIPSLVTSTVGQVVCLIDPDYVTAARKLRSGVKVAGRLDVVSDA